MIKELLGQKKILSQLRKTIENNTVGHAYIFEGPDGVGKRETARSFCSMLLCGSPEFPCGECMPCKLFSQSSNPDFTELFLEGKSISVDDIREVLKTIVIKPMYSKYKAVLINDADEMTLQAQNALLKSLEEPPEYLIFILTVKSSTALAQTIRSRCQRVLFPKASDNEIKYILSGKYGEKVSNLDFVVSYSDGVIGTAINLAESNTQFELRDNVIKSVSKLLSGSKADIFQIYELFEQNEGKIDFIMQIMLLYFRDLLIYSKTRNSSLLINSDKKDMIISDAGIGYANILSSIRSIWDACKCLDYNVNFQLSIETMLLKIQDMKGMNKW
jgi:DNA polymerase-3 subunit delta'